MIVDYSTRKANLGECSKNSSFGNTVRRSNSLGPTRTRGRGKTPRTVKSALKLWDQVDLLDESSGRHERNDKLEENARKICYTPAALQVRRRSSFNDINSDSLTSLNLGDLEDVFEETYEEAPWKPVGFNIRKATSGNQLDARRHRSSTRGREIAGSLSKEQIATPSTKGPSESVSARERSLSPEGLARERSCSPGTPTRRNGSGTSLAVAPPEYWAKPEHQLGSGLVGLPGSQTGSCPSLSLLSSAGSSASASTNASSRMPRDKKRRGRHAARSKSPTSGGAGWRNLSCRNLMASQSSISSSISNSGSLHSTASNRSTASSGGNSNQFVTGSRIRRHNGENKKVASSVASITYSLPPMLGLQEFLRNSTV